MSGKDRRLNHAERTNDEQRDAHAHGIRLHCRVQRRHRAIYQQRDSLAFRCYQALEGMEMILIGFNFHEAQMEPPPRRESGSRQAQSNRILAGVQEFLRQLARWENRFLSEENTRFRNSFIEAEAQALSAPDLNLEADRSIALSRRAPFRLSWVFARIHELASNQNIDIEVWSMPYGPSAGFTGHTSGLPPHIVITLNDRLQGAELGQTLCHELSIHAWRKVRYGDTRTITTGVHRDDFHRQARLGPDYHPHHSLADTEADLLSLIFRGSPPRRRILPSAQREHDRYVWQVHDSVMAACQGRNLQSDLLPILTSDQEYRLWQLYCPARAGAVLSHPRPLGQR